ncbi:MAG: YaiI/YqxD family protein [Planctomycetes bacterium]|nr:YaiI/YqxD family protein [Planctomycetota bacterium]
MLTLYVDADACPVKNEVYRVAKRLELRVFVVANQPMTTPASERITSVVVRDGFDAADDWIVERVSWGDVVITADIPLASRCLENGARVLDPKGREFTEDSIGDALASRQLMQELRDMGIETGGPKAMQSKDRSRFLQRLDEVIVSIRKQARTRRPESPGS